MTDRSIGEISRTDIVRMTADVVSAYVGNHECDAAHLPGVIDTVFGTLTRLANGAAPAAPRKKAKAAVSIKKSVTPEYLVCLEDGKRLKMLKRHLRTNYDMTPDQYRLKWGLPSDYPMVAPNYAAQRSAFAKKIGLGRSGRKSAH